MLHVEAYAHHLLLLHLQEECNSCLGAPSPRHGKSTWARRISCCSVQCRRISGAARSTGAGHLDVLLSAWAPGLLDATGRWAPGRGQECIQEVLGMARSAARMCWVRPGGAGTARGAGRSATQVLGAAMRRWARRWCWAWPGEVGAARRGWTRSWRGEDGFQISKMSGSGVELSFLSFVVCVWKSFPIL